MDAQKKSNISRRAFVSTTAAVAGGLTILNPKPAVAQTAKKTFKVGLIGCGGRGTGALSQHVKAAQILNSALNLGVEVRVTALADWFKPKAEQLGDRYGVSARTCYGGGDAYKKLLDSDIDIVLMATPPVFRPAHFEAAIKAGKHVFMEKPSAVDPVGIRRVLAAGKLAEQKNLMVIAGTQRRHQKNYNDNRAAVAEGKIGDIRGGRVSWCQGHIFEKEPFGKVTPDILTGRWMNWIEMSGDHIVEQHVHNIDIMNWFLGGHPTSAVGFGGRARRPVGNQFDFFSVDFTFRNRVKIHSTCRQMAGCANMVGEYLVGAKGITNCHGGLTPDKSPIPAEIPQQGGGHQQEHIDMLYYLMKDKIINETENVATSTATAILGRTACYTGQEIFWQDMFERENPRKKELYNLQLSPTAEDFEGNLDDIHLPEEGVVPIPGRKA